MAVLHDQVVVAGGQADADHDDGEHAVGQRRASAEGDEGIHAGRAGLDALPAREEERAVDPADGQGQHQLSARVQDGVPAAAVEHTAQRQADHVAHRDVHKRDKEAEAGNQALFELGSLGVLELGAFALGGGEGRAVPGGVHGAEDAPCRGIGVGVGGVVYLHRVGQQAYGDGCHTRHRRNGFFHMACAGRAAHAGDFVALHGDTPFLVVQRKPSPEGEGGAKRRMRGELTDTARERVALAGSALISHLR